ILNFLFAGVASGPAEPTARTTKTYQCGLRRRYRLGEAQALKAGFAPVLPRRAHSKPPAAAAFPASASNLKVAASFAWLILTLSIFVFGGVGGGALRVNVAATGWFAFSVTWQSPVPEQPPPDDPSNVEPASAEAESVTTVPWS